MPIARSSRHGLALDGAEDYTALAAQGAQMQEVAQGEQADDAQVPSGTSSVSVQGSAGTSVSLAAPSLGLSVKGEGLSGSATGPTTLTGGLILPRCTTHSLNSYYATDHLGTVRFVKTVDESGTEVATSTHDYEPFGVEITPADACDNTHRFTGHERDALPDGTNIDYMHFRFYGASIGRFQKPDSNFDHPIANPQGWNLYSYVKGNPVNFNDPTGHQSTLVPGGPPTPAVQPGNAGATPESKAADHQREAERDRHIGKLTISNATKGQVQKLLNDLQSMTGFNLTATSKDGKTWTVTATGCSSGGYSATAQKDLSTAMQANMNVHKSGGHILHSSSQASAPCAAALMAAGLRSGGGRQSPHGDTEGYWVA